MAAAVTVFLCLAVALFVITAQARQAKIPGGSSLSTASPLAWPSASGRFAFGFYPVAGGFMVGVWLETVPNTTIVWTAFRDDPPVTSGTLALLNGRLQLTATGTDTRYIYDAIAGEGSYACMRDTGDFVIYDDDGRLVWSTFNYPTDTIMAGQTLRSGYQLLSSASESNRSTGSFRLEMQYDGSLVLYLYPAESMDTVLYAYWRFGTTDAQSLQASLSLQLDREGSLFLSADSGTKTRTKLAEAKNSGPSSEVLYRVTLDADGILRLYSHTFHGDGSSPTRSVQWQAPDDPCRVKGICGFNSYCKSSEDKQPECLCPPRFRFVDPQQRSLGCERNFTIGGCDGAAGGASGAGASITMNALWEDIAYAILSSSSAEDCRAACLADCQCDAALFQLGRRCSKQTLPLRYGRWDGYTQAFLKVGDEIETHAVNSRKNVTMTKTDENSRPLHEGKTVSLVALLAISAASVVCSVVLASVCTALIYKRRVGRSTSTASVDGEAALRSFSYGELATATNGFKEELGKGAFGTVFKGALGSPSGEKTVAVKRLDKMEEEGEREFQREVQAIGRIHHKNLVRLLGFCNEGAHRMLVYDYMSNGSLAKFLFKAEARAGWVDRVRIALDVARGLHYLHDECEARIIHCDIKPQNILIDDAGTAKISDFGLAKLLPPEQTRTITKVRGTPGYLAPEWHRNAPITTKADVYSFGVVLLEVVCCRRNLELGSAEDEIVLTQWAFSCLLSRELPLLVNGEDVELGELERMVRVGLWCVQSDPASRPPMRNVVLMVEGNMKVALPPPPEPF